MTSRLRTASWTGILLAVASARSDIVAYRRPPGTRTSVYFGFVGHGLVRIPFSHWANVPKVPNSCPVSSSSGTSAGRNGPVRHGFGEVGWVGSVGVWGGVETVDVVGVGGVSTGGMIGKSGFAATGASSSVGSLMGHWKGSVTSIVR